MKRHEWSAVPLSASRIRTIILSVLVSLWLALLLTGCGHERPNPEVMAKGKEVYYREGSCITCHKSTGLGQPPLFPPLWKNPRVLDQDPTRLIRIVTHGLQGPLEVDGQTYNSAMPGQGAQLKPDEIAAVLTFIRHAWGHHAPPVSTNKVRAVQMAHADRLTPWTVAELEGKPLESASVEKTEDPIEWGRQLYLGAAQCASCHQPDGKGVSGSYPPLAKSPWVTGDVERLIKVALHGVAGEIELLGETYQNEMPGQGALLDDEQMAATLSYIRQAWGNDAGPIYPDQVRKIRDKYTDRHEPWPADQLASLDLQSPLKWVKYRQYDIRGVENKVKLNTPEFDALPVLDEGEIPNRFFDLRLIKGTNDHDVPFAVVLEAEIDVPVDDEYYIVREGNGATVVLIDGEVVMGDPEITNKWSADRKRVQLTKGTHRIKLYYAKISKWRNFNMSARAESLNRALWQWTRGRTTDIVLSDPAYLLVPSLDEVIFLRGRFEGQGLQGIAVGHPLRVNYSFDFQRSQMMRLWLGDFINSAGHWAGRNELHIPPAGDHVLKLSGRPPLALLGSADAAWPKDPGTNVVPDGYDFRGHAIVDKLPVYYSRYHHMLLRDAVVPIAAENTHGLPKAQRTLEVFSETEEPALHALLAEGKQIEPQDDGAFLVDGQYRIVLIDHDNSTKPTVVEQDGRQLLVAPAAWQPSKLDVPEWTLRTTPLTPQSSVVRATWQFMYQWVEEAK